MVNLVITYGLVFCPIELIPRKNGPVNNHFLIGGASLLGDESGNLPAVSFHNLLADLHLVENNLKKKINEIKELNLKFDQVVIYWGNSDYSREKLFLFIVSLIKEAFPDLPIMVVGCSCNKGCKESICRSKGLLYDFSSSDCGGRILLNKYLE